MHPEIKKFWEDSGYTIRWRSNIPNVADAVKNDKVVYIGICVKSTNLTTLYRWADNAKSPGVWHSEEEMLKIVKMKAFL